MNTITIVHVVISFIALAAGFVIVWGMLKHKPLNMGHVIFLSTTIATNATGFLFPFKELLPSHILAVLSLLILALAVYARYRAKPTSRWRATYAISAIVAFYVNFFVLIVQAFLKVPALKALAPTQKEPPFFVAQLVALIAFSVVGYIATRCYKAAPAEIAE